MKKCFKNIALVLLGFILGVLSLATYKVYQKKKHLFQKSVKLQKLKNCFKKEIVFIPMHHVGQEGFYKSVKDSIIVLKKEGFIVYYEGVKEPNELDSLKHDIVLRKFRKIIGHYPSRKNKRKQREIKSTIVQPKDKSLGIKIKEDLNVDMEMSVIVDSCEKKYGKIVLTSIDTLPLDDPTYRQKKIEDRFNYTTKIRDDFLFNKIVSSQHQKIAILYGSSHKKGIINRIKANCKITEANYL